MKWPLHRLIFSVHFVLLTKRKECLSWTKTVKSVREQSNWICNGFFVGLFAFFCGSRWTSHLRIFAFVPSVDLLKKSVRIKFFTKCFFQSSSLGRIPLLLFQRWEFQNLWTFQIKDTDIRALMYPHMHQNWAHPDCFPLFLRLSPPSHRKQTETNVLMKMHSEIHTERDKLSVCVWRWIVQRKPFIVVYAARMILCKLKLYTDTLTYGKLDCDFIYLMVADREREGLLWKSIVINMRCWSQFATSFFLQSGVLWKYLCGPLNWYVPQTHKSSHTLEQTHIKCRIPSQTDGHKYTRTPVYDICFSMPTPKMLCWWYEHGPFRSFFSASFHVHHFYSISIVFAPAFLCSLAHSRECPVWCGSDIYLPFYVTRMVHCFGLGTLICYIVNTYLFVCLQHLAISPFVHCGLLRCDCVCLCRFKSNGIQFDVTNKMKNINST